MQCSDILTIQSINIAGAHKALVGLLTDRRMASVFMEPISEYTRRSADTVS